MKAESLREKRPQILALAEEYGARNVQVFGSVARGEALPDSERSACAYSRSRFTRGDPIVRSDRERLLDILEAIERIETHKGVGRLIDRQARHDKVPNLLRKRYGFLSFFHRKFRKVPRISRGYRIGG